MFVYEYFNRQNYYVKRKNSPIIYHISTTLHEEMSFSMKVILCTNKTWQNYIKIMEQQ